ncbi:IclR family transcriptional regulator [Achromobacter animicus]|uniref:IclR family transcriptional regulator n=1 Tax=Achromobacter animicus TaxID=1389935 RepID=UPI00244C9F34|nr:IclR family transcriptional regulator [Achromobacter animicus]MDH0683056.1 IclR family transcriptional regulator [Achromobacter animicus]
MDHNNSKQKPTRRLSPIINEASSGGEDRQFSMNLARGLEVLRSFTAADPVLTNRTISERTGLPKATVSRLTYTLTAFGYLRQDDAGAYRLGTAVLSLAHPVLGGLALRQIARPVLQELAASTGCTVNLATQERVHAIYIDSVRSDLANPYLPDVGSVSPLLHSAIGRALVLAHQGTHREQLLNRIKVADPQAYAAGIEYLQADELLFRSEGHCRARGPWLADIDAIATHIPLPSSTEAAAINCTRSNKAVVKIDLAKLVPQLQAAAKKISLLHSGQLGGQLAHGV